MTVDGVTAVDVTLGVMSDEQRTTLREKLRGGAGEPVIPFAEAGSLTRVYAVAPARVASASPPHRQPGRRDGRRRGCG